ncbi:MAG: D-aminoacylase [Planctomycetes bacterium]|nr:D-aminoacylase [Planctomycetota bacterium]
MDLDLVLARGLLLDGSGGPGRPADVGVAGAGIAAVGAPGTLAGREVVDCSGLAIAPGFLDTHSHSDLRVLDEPGLPMKVHQGITLEIFGQDGISVAPVKPQRVSETRRMLRGLLGDTRRVLHDHLGRARGAWQWESVGDYLDTLERLPLGIDAAYLVPHGALRDCVMGPTDRKADADDLRGMQELLAASLDQGGIGLSSGLIYPPCCFADTAELIELCRVPAARGLPFVVHIRNEGDRMLEALDEMAEVARASGVHVHISHFKIAGRTNWRKLEEVIARIESFRAAGLTFTADQYPYIAGSTMLGAILPPWAHVGGPEAACRRLDDPAQRAQMEREMLDPADVAWDNFWKWSGPEGIIVADVPSGRRPELVGQTLAAGAQAAGRAPLAFALDLLRDEHLGVSMVSFSQSEAVVERFLKLPWVCVCTDGLLGGKPHPRAYGTYPKILGRYVRERRVLSLAEAVRKMTSQAAETFHLAGHGRVAPGYRANLVVFDPERVLDRATFEEPAAYPAGMPHVVVGGRFVVRDGAGVSGSGSAGAGRVVRERDLAKR